ncbi:hypothetical protein E1267_00590 [Nonomuraea longispora]|uniref:Uncharacterized protein n=1 Tax=Nonomuraea longispora TaxID=1848320 RepID=A0A4R4NVS1_9ACTN|nr:hypothetical protein [Nonomuraea longispora]TDC11472.1 hypothetical protein E1267_00590 [Nonomuraea longispora]
MRSARRIIAISTALAAATAPLLAVASPAAAAQPATTVQQALPLDDVLPIQGLNPLQQLKRVKQLLKSGYVPQALSVTNAANPQYASVWVKDTTRKVNVLQGLSALDLQKRITEQLRLGFVPSIISGTGSGPGAIFAAVFEKKASGKAEAKVDLTKDAFQKLNTQLSGSGLSLASVDVYGTVEKPLYAAVWVAGAATGAVKVSLGQTVEQRGKELLAMAKQGLRPVLMAIEPGQLYTTVWSKGSTTGLKEHLNLNRVTYTVQNTKMKALGYTPVVLDTAGNTFAAIWSKG